MLHDGSLVVVDRSLYTINLFDTDGNLIAVFGGQGSAPESFPIYLMWPFILRGVL